MRSLHSLRSVEMTKERKTVEMTKREKTVEMTKRAKTLEMTGKRRLGKLQNYKITITVRIFGKN